MITVELPLPDLDTIPLWAWITAGLVSMYAILGRVIARGYQRGDFVGRSMYPVLARLHPADRQYTIEASYYDAVVFWVFSPLLVPLDRLIIRPGVYVVGTPLWILSGGLIPPPWRVNFPWQEQPPTTPT